MESPSMSAATSAIQPATPDARYPIGKFVPPDIVTPEDRRYAILTLAETPEQLREAVRPLNPDQVNTPYRAVAEGLSPH